ncbi:MAG: hypothetical protein K0Q48_3305 [Bacillota bacterium]|jgi:DNA-binding transcriptional regulator of glucitol operon|nr:hypothetical protein [Bacillota bacterium]
MFWDIVVIAGAFWIVMSIFSFIQSVHIKNIYKVLEPTGTVYFGRDAGFLRTSYYAFAAVDGNGTVQNAKLLKASRIITIPRLEPLDHLIDKNLSTLDPSVLSLNKGAQQAVISLVTNFDKKKKSASK